MYLRLKKLEWAYVGDIYDLVVEICNYTRKHNDEISKYFMGC